MSPLRLHPLVARLLPTVQERRALAVAKHEFDGHVRRFEKAWASKPLPDRGCSPVQLMGTVLELDAIVDFAKGDVPAFSAAFRNAMAFQGLSFRWHVFIGMARPEGTVPVSAWETVKVAGPSILSQWSQARTLAEALIVASHTDMQRTAKEVRAQYWGKGTVDALLVGLLSQAFDIPTHYQPVHPLAAPYRDLLQHWRTVDEAVFRKAMHAAAEFHIACSGDSSDDVRYEFDWLFDQIFPLELLVIQALRRRDELPAFDVGHTLVDAPWTVLRDLPEAEPHPLLARVEQRLRQDYAAFR